MEENIFNFFLYPEDPELGLITRYGVKSHKINGTDQEKYAFLKQQVPSDYESASLFQVPKRFVTVFDEDNYFQGCIRVSSVIEMLGMNDISIFEEALCEYDAPNAPLFVNTLIENGKPVGIMTARKAKKGGNTIDALLRRGVSSDLSEGLLRKGYTLAKLKLLSNSELKALSLNPEQIAAIQEGGRPPIPEDVYIKLLYEAKRTCCVCRDPSKPIIIHHLEEWSKSRSHDESNLVVLCLEHHDQAHTKKELSISLNKKQLVEFKSKWLEQSRTSDAEAILGLVSRDFARWDYFNHARVYELFLEMDIDPTNFKTFKKLNDANYVDSLGILNIAAIQEMNSDESYMYRDGNGFITVFYMKEVFQAVLARLPVVDITDKFNRSHIVSLLRPGSFIALQAGFYYKQATDKDSGGGQLRRAYYKKRGVKIEFSFDPYEATSSSAYNDSLAGHSVSTVICIVKSIYDKDDFLNIDVGCLAIGSYLEDCKFRAEQKLLRRI